MACALSRLVLNDQLCKINGSLYPLFSTKWSSQSMMCTAKFPLLISRCWDDTVELLESDDIPLVAVFSIVGDNY